MVRVRAGAVDTNEFSKQLIPVIRFVSTIGFIIVIIVFLVIGIKYMIASPTGKADLKGKLVGAVIAMVIVFGSYTIWSIVYNIFLNLSKTVQ